MSTTLARLDCDEPTARRLVAVLGESLETGTAACAAFETAEGCWQVAVHFRDPPDPEIVRALVRTAVGDSAAEALVFASLPDTDWVAHSLAGLAPVRVGRFFVHGAHDRPRVPANAVGIEIEAAQAFGTGHHGTTAGCLVAIEMLAKGRAAAIRPTPGKYRPARSAGRRRGMRGGCADARRGGRKAALRLLDIGTGSGVLAIAAARRLRCPVVASDIDPRAVSTARANARLNGAASLVRVLHAAGVNAAMIARKRPYRVVLANILLAPLVRLAVPIGRLVAPSGWIVLSGLLPAQANAALAAYRAQRLVLHRRILRGGWVTLLLGRHCRARRER